MFQTVFTKVLVVAGEVVYLGCIVHVVTSYVARPTLCVGESMQPTINSTSSNDIVLMEHVSTRNRLLRRNDVVIVRSLQDPDMSICKRIAAMEGDLIRADIISNDEHVKRTIKVPKGHVWLLGDNAENSVDSRTFGPVPYGLIVGRVCYKLYPFCEFGPIS